MTKQELLDKANDLPLAPGVYLMMDKTGCVIYVGKAKKLKNRVSQYFQENSSHNEKTRRMVSQVDHFDTIFVSTEFEALILENSLIKQHMPRYNILLKDDKGYPFVRLGTEHYPRFTMASKPADDNALYFGPFGGRNETRAAIDAICAAFRLPTCSRKFPRDIGKERPCLNHHMGRCDAFCRGTPDEDEYMRRIGQAEELLSAARLDAAQAAIKSPEACTVWRLGPLSAADALILEAAMHSLTAPVRDAEEKYVQLLCGLVRRGSGAVQLTDRVRFCAGDGCFWQEIVPERPRQQEDKRPESQPFQPEKQAEYCLAGGWKVTAGLFTADFEEKIQVVHKKDLKNQADYARITTLYAGLVLRTRQPGDVYRPAGRSVHNRLRKWMNETGIPASQRDQLPLLAAGSEVLWVCGAGFAEGLAPDADTAQVLQMEMEHREEIT